MVHCAHRKRNVEASSSFMKTFLMFDCEYECVRHRCGVWKKERARKKKKQYVEPHDHHEWFSCSSHRCSHCAWCNNNMRYKHAFILKLQSVFYFPHFAIVAHRCPFNTHYNRSFHTLSFSISTSLIPFCLFYLRCVRCFFCFFLLIVVVVVCCNPPRSLFQ